MVELAPNNPYGLTLARPVIAAAGCFGYGVEYARSVDLAAFGAIITRTTTLLPRRVAQPPRLLETAAGLLAVGTWPNPGLNIVLSRYAPEWAGWSTPVILSIGGTSVGEFGQIAAATEGVEGIAGFEIALPDDLSRAAGIVGAVRRASPLPVLVKLPLIEAEPLLELARAVAQAGADALTLFAPPRGLHVDADSGEHDTGWLCGPAIQPLVLARFAEIAPNVDIPVVVSGGVARADDARQALRLGATAVQLGAVLLVNPHAAAEGMNQL